MHRYRKYFIAGSIIWSLFILSLAIIPADDLPAIPVRNIDKVVHFGMFLGFSFLVSGAWGTGRTWKSFLPVVLLTLPYGFLLEWLQQFIPGRTVDVVDVLFNFAGVFSGMVFYRLMSNKIIH